MKLPPLNALKSFEAAARKGSFKLAALELGVTAAAVSQQVRNLENFFNKNLFNRSNNRIALTDAGNAIYRDVASAMQDIASIAERFTDGDNRARLVISVIPALAERWLTPRLTEFSRTHANVSLEIRVEDDPVNLMGNNIDLRLTYGDQLYPQHHAQALFRDAVTPRHAPGFASQYGGQIDFQRVADEHLIHVDWGENIADYPDWQAWFTAAGISRQPDISRGIKVYSANLAIALASSGLGVALAQVELTKHEVSLGTLIRPSSIKLTLPRHYHAICTDSQIGYSPLKGLLDVLCF